MKKIHPFLIIGSVAFFITGVLHMAVALLSGSASLSVWLPIYIVWLVFMCIGLTITVRSKRRIPESNGS